MFHWFPKPNNPGDESRNRMESQSCMRDHTAQLASACDYFVVE